MTAEQSPETLHDSLDYRQRGREFGKMLVAEVHRRADGGLEVDWKNLTLDRMKILALGGATIEDLNRFLACVDAEVSAAIDVAQGRRPRNLRLVR